MGGLELTNFRSYERARFDLHPDVTIVAGPNASGKTNLLESLYVLAATKSFRARDRDLIRHDQDHFRVVATGDGLEYAMGVTTAAGPLEKKITHDGVKRTLVAHVGTIQVVLFEPTDLELVSGPPEARRRYLDFMLCQTDRAYLKTMQLYRRALRQRNALFERADPLSVADQMFAWNVNLAELATEVHERRLHLVDELNTLVPKLYADIAGSRQPVEFRYISTIAGNYRDDFLSELERNLPRDMAAGFTTIGPHREDFKVGFKNNDIMAVASRGEVRTVVLSMKLAELAYCEEQTQVRPILLLDDVFSELDQSRRSYLVERLKSHQTIITTTDVDATLKHLTTPHAVISTEMMSHA
jgi:DNA replication and repair protein RecF